MVKQIRQGDVLLLEQDTAKKVKEVAPVNGKVILAFGEVTGHHHRFEGEGVKMFLDDAGGATGSGRVYVDVKKPSDLIHEEHSKITLPVGTFEQAFQVEYTPKELRRVAD